MTLSDTCAAIEKKFRDTEVLPFERYSGEIWRIVLNKFPEYLPPWFRCLTMEYQVGGFYFQKMICDRDYLGQFVFPRPSNAICFIYEPWPVPQLFSHGLSAFADGTTGDCWVMRKDAQPEDPVYFLHLTAWNGGVPTVTAVQNKLLLDKGP